MWTSKSLLNLLWYCCFVFWLFGCEACGILTPWRGIKFAAPALEDKVPTTGLSEKFLGQTFLFLANVSKHTANTKPSFNICNSIEFARRWNIIFRFFLDMINDKFSSVSHSCPTLCNFMDCSTPGLPVPHQLPEFTQTHVHWVSDAIQSSHPLSSPSPPAFNISQHQSLFNDKSGSFQWQMILQNKILIFIAGSIVLKKMIFTTLTKNSTREKSFGWPIFYALSVKQYAYLSDYTCTLTFLNP